MCQMLSQGTTTEDQDWAWRRWVEYCHSIGITTDFYLDFLEKPDRIKIVGAFSVALREGCFSRSAHETLAESTILGAVSYVASTFRDNDRPNPTRDEDGELGRLLSRLWRAFRAKDPAEKQQKALPAVVLLEIAKLQHTETQRAISQLSIGAFYFAMWSCKYVKVPAAENRLRCVVFRRNGAIIPHDSPDLELADFVSITFEMQKKDEKFDRVTQHATGHEIMCPVRIWAAIIKRIRSYPGADDDTPVSAVWRNNRIEHITSQNIINAIDNAAESIGYASLGVEKGDFGTHSIRSGGAMSMALDDVPPFRIMFIGGSGKGG
jgi:hypothetical protein